MDEHIKLFFCDVETTGVDPKKNGITQIAVEIGKLFIDGRYSADRMLDLPVAPFPGDEIEPTALEVQKRTLEEVRAYPSPSVTHATLTRVLGEYVDKYDSKDKFFFIAYNSPFDNQFMREFWTKNKDTYFGSWFFNPDICVMRMAMDALRFMRAEMPNFKLGTVAGAMGIRYDDSALHNAATDIAITRQLYLRLTDLIHNA